MSKLIKIALAAAFFLLTACQKQNLDPQSVYTEALNKMAELDAYHLSGDLHISLGSGNEDEVNLNLEFPLSLSLTAQDIKDDNPTIYASIALNLFGQSVEMKEWLTDGFVYSDLNGEKTATPSINADIGGYFHNFDNQYATLSGQSDGDSYILKAEYDADTLNDLIAKLFQEEDLSALFTFNEPFISEMTINKDYYITAIKLENTLNITDLGILNIDGEFVFSDFDNAEVPAFNPEEFINDAAYISGYIYGDYDLNDSHSEQLIALGYEKLEDGIFYNGNYYIDIEFKQFYPDDKLIYDWEFNQVSEYDKEDELVCIYDFDYGIVDGEENSCDIAKYENLKADYDNLAATIIGNAEL